MAISYVGGQTTSWAGSSSGTPNTVTFSLSGGSGATPAAGDLVIITSAVAHTDDAPNCDVSGYTNLTQRDGSASGIDLSLNVAYKFMGGTPDTTVEITNSGNAENAKSIAIQVFRGVDAAVWDATPVGADGTGTGRPDPPSITPVTAGAWIVVGCGGSAGTGASLTHSTLTNFITLNRSDTNDAVVGAGYKSDWVSGAFDPVACGGGSTGATNAWAAYTLALKPASDARSASATQTLDTVTQSATGVVRVAAAASQTLATVTQSATGTVLVEAEAAQTLATVTQDATGTVEDAPTEISASADQTLDSVTQDATGTVEGGEVTPPPTTGGGGGGGKRRTSFSPRGRGTAKLAWKPDEDELKAIYERLTGIAQPPAAVVEAIEAIEEHEEEERIDFAAAARDIAALEAVLEALEAEELRKDALAAIEADRLIEEDDEDVLTALLLVA